MMDNKKYTKVILSSVIFVVIVLVGILFYPHKYEIASNGLGNSMSNIKNCGYIGKYGDYIYYSNATDNRSLHRFNVINGEDIKLTDSGISSINLVGDWVYFCSGYPGNILRIKHNSTKIENISFKSYYKVVTTDKYIFAIESKENKEQKLYRMNLNGRHKKMILKNIGKDYYIDKDRIYFLNGNDNYSLYSCDFYGRNLIKHSKQQNLRDVIVFDGSIYYHDKYGKYIYKNNLSGDDEKIIYTGRPTNLNISNLGIIFNDKDVMCYMDLDGNNLKTINHGIFDDINVLDNLIVYTRPVQIDDGKETGIYISDLEGKNEVLLTEDAINNIYNNPMQNKSMRLKYN